MPVGRCKSSSAKDRTRRACGASIRRGDVPASSGRFPGAAARWVRCAPDETTRHAPGRPDPARARRLRRRARLLLRDLPAQQPSWSSGSTRRWSRTTTRARAAASCAGCTSRRARRGEARALRARGDLRRPRRRAPRVADLRRSGRASSSATRTCTCSTRRSASPMASACSATSPTSSTSRTPTTSPTSTERASSTTIPTSAIEWPLPADELVPSAARRRRAAAQGRGGRPAVRIPLSAPTPASGGVATAGAQHEQRHVVALLAVLEGLQRVVDARGHLVGVERAPLRRAARSGAPRRRRRRPRRACR